MKYQEHMFVIYHIETTRILRARWYHKGYETEDAAKAGLTRHLKKDKSLERKDYAISDDLNFFNLIEKKVTRYHLLSRKPFEIGINTPDCLDPSTETYHSM